MPDDDERTLRARCESATVELLAATRAGLLSDERFLTIARELPAGVGPLMGDILVEVGIEMIANGSDAALQSRGLAAKRVLWLPTDDDD